jgi:hypothetical protein
MGERSLRAKGLLETRTYSPEQVAIDDLPKWQKIVTGQWVIGNPDIFSDTRKVGHFGYLMISTAYVKSRTLGNVRFPGSRRMSDFALNHWYHTEKSPDMDTK